MESFGLFVLKATFGEGIRKEILCGRRVEGRSGGHGVGRTPGHVGTSAGA